jgi:hypothetical protein
LDLLVRVIDSRQTLTEAVKGLSIPLVVLGIASLLLIAALVQWISCPDDIPRAVALLRTPAGKLYRYSPDANGTIHQEHVMDEPSIGGGVVTNGGHPVSVAMSADGTLLASMAGQRLSFQELNPATGETYPWGNSITFPDRVTNPRIVAVSGKGHRDAWFALVTEQSDPGRPGPLFVGTHGTRQDLTPIPGRLATHAVFWGMHLLFDFDTIFSLFSEDVRLPHFNKRKLIAVDAAQVGGRTYLAILATANSGEAAGDAAKGELIVLPVDGGKPRAVDVIATDVRIVRALEGTEQDVQVLVDTEPLPIFPFVSKETTSLGSRTRTWLGALNLVPERRTVTPNE